MSNTKIRKTASAAFLLAGACALCWTPALAATTTSTFSVTMTIAASCTISSASALAFGSSGVLTANVDQSSTI